jgi:hypothetical protein
MKPIKHPLLSEFSVSKTGAVVSKTGKIMQPRMHPTGYLMVALSERSYFVHKLVAMTYIVNPLLKERVMHLDGVKINNSVDNLFYANSNSFDELKIKYLYSCGNTVDRIAKGFNLSKVRVYQIVKEIC